MAERGSPWAASTSKAGEEVDPSDVSNDMTPSEQQQLIATLSKVNANVKLQLFYSEKKVEDLTEDLTEEDTVTDAVGLAAGFWSSSSSSESSMTMTSWFGT